jgi:hypothetical protein
MSAGDHGLDEWIMQITPLDGRKPGQRCICICEADGCVDVLVALLWLWR